MEKLKVGDTVQVTRGAERTQKTSRGKIQAIDRTANRMRLFGIEGTVSWIERKGPSLVLVLGAPAWSAARCWLACRRSVRLPLARSAWAQ